MPSPMWNKVLANCFPLESRPSLCADPGYISQWLFFFCHSHQETFLGSRHENRVGFLRIKPMKIWHPPSDLRLWALEFLVLSY